ncbi:MAG: hypothetical protein JKX99_03725 [Robiginitomaculum sp.]|nr:hypothetical protein [Robiginitomaculum sp.]
MSEFEVLNLIQLIIANQYAILAQIVGLNFALVIAVFYFLYKSGRRMQGFVFAIYTMGFVMYAGILSSDSLQILAAENTLRAMAETESLSALGQNILATTRNQLGAVVNVATFVGFGTLWLCMAYFTFFWKRPIDR